MSPKQIEFRLHQIILDMQVADERLLTRVEFDTVSPGDVRMLAAALLTGDTQFIRTADETADSGALAPDWGSWIEGQPMTTAILGNRAVLVDLHPLDPAEFAKKYRCSVGQFIAILKWFSRHRKRIYVNLIGLDPNDPDSFARYSKNVDSIGIILQEIESNEQFYCLPVRRHLLFGISDRDGNLDRRRLLRERDWAVGYIGEGYAKLSQAFARFKADADRMADARDPMRGAIVRGGDMVGNAQLTWRIAYYRAYRAIFETADETEIDRLLRSQEPSAEELAALTSLITSYHHRYTAPITGAFGGTYNLRMAEFGPMVANIGLSPEERIYGAKAHKALSDAETTIWDWAATGKIGTDQKKFVNEAATPWAMAQRERTIDDDTIDYILNQAKPITDDIMAYRDDLIRGVRKAIADDPKQRKWHGIEEKDEDWEQIEAVDQSAIVSEIDRAVQKMNGVLGGLAGKIMVSVGVKTGLGLSGPVRAAVGLAVTGLPDVMKEALGSGVEDGAKEFFGQMIGRTYARTQIVEVLDNISAIRNPSKSY